MTRPPTTGALGLATLLLAAAACSGEDDPSTDPAGAGASSTGMQGTGLPGPGTSPNVPAPTGAGVANYGRPPGMPIGQGGPSGGNPPGATPGEAAAPDDAEVTDDFEIPVLMPMEQPPPCSGCVELNVDVNDINQRDSFVFAGGEVNVTRVIWTIIAPFNSDQLFVQPFVNNAYGTFTELDANDVHLNEPYELEHDYMGVASTVGLSVGSSGAWTGNMTMSVFVDSVTLEGADPSASRTFDTDLQGLVVGSNAHNAKIVYHP